MSKIKKYYSSATAVFKGREQKALSLLGSWMEM